MVFNFKHMKVTEEGKAKVEITAENGESIDVIFTLDENGLTIGYESKSIVKTSIEV